MYSASVIIPAYGRQELLDRAILSVIKQPFSDMAEIIVVDDCSPEPLKLTSNRKQDVIIRNKVNSGAAVSRNKGMAIARGKWIFLLDSDDYFIKVTFDDLSSRDKNSLYFCNVFSQNKKNIAYKQIDDTNFFSEILCRNQGILQTSSLSFYHLNGAEFDESLPKHQDWDFVYTQFIKKNKLLVFSSDIVFFDKSDKGSLSRSTDPSKSVFWIEKLKQNHPENAIWNRNLEVRFLGVSSKYFSLKMLVSGIFLEVLNGRLKVVDALKIYYRRFFNY